MQFDQNGFYFSDENETAAMVNSYADLKKIKVHAFVVSKEKFKIIVLYDLESNLPIYQSPSVEDMGAHIDQLVLIQRTFA